MLLVYISAKLLAGLAPAFSAIFLNALWLTPDPFAKWVKPIDCASSCVWEPLRTASPFSSPTIWFLWRGNKISPLFLTMASWTGPVVASLTIATVFWVKRPFEPRANLTGLITWVLPPNWPRTWSIPLIPELTSSIVPFIAECAYLVMWFNSLPKPLEVVEARSTTWLCNDVICLVTPLLISLYLLIAPFRLFSACFVVVLVILRQLELFFLVSSLSDFVDLSLICL